MAPKSSNKNTVKNIDKVDVDLKFDKDAITAEDGTRVVLRTWVNKDKFPEFKDAYDNSQENSSLSDSSEVQFRVKTTIRYYDPHEEIKKEKTAFAFVEMTTVYGGTEGIKLFLKQQIMESVYRWEDSGQEIVSMEIQNLYINRTSVIKNYSFREMKMYGAKFNYLGYMANAGYNDNCCVPKYIFNTLHNPNETNPRKRIAKLTMKNVIDDLGMVTEDEGCSIAQIANLCNKRKVIYYALNFKYKLFETNKDNVPKTNLPRLVFICANNHLYPITDEEKRETIFKTYSNTGGQIKKYKTQQKFEHKKSNGTEEQIYVFQEGMSIYGLLEHVKNKYEEDKESKYRIIITQRGVCNELFYEEITRFGNIHNGYVKMNKNNQITGFKWQDDITIDENENYNDVKLTMQELNADIIKEEDKYKYTGQSIHSLAYAYYTNNYDRQIVSKCSPQVHDILTSKLSMNSPLIEFYTDKADIAFDVNKQYTNILMNCDEFGWAVYMPTDQVEEYDGTIDTGRYYIETSECFALEGNGWYCDSVIKKALQFKLITEEDIKYQLKSSMCLKPDHFKQFVLDVYEKFECPKQAINGFIGLLGKSKTTTHQHYFESDYNVVANELIHNDDDIHIRGIFKENNDTVSVNMLNLNNDDLQKLIQEAEDNKQEPMIYQLTRNKVIPKWENTLPIHRKIYDIARMQMYEIDLEIQQLNPNCYRAGVKVDCLAYNNITTLPQTSTSWGHIKKCDVPTIHACTINQPSRIRTETYKLTDDTWKNIIWNTNDGYFNDENLKMDNNLPSYIEQSCLFLGMAGTGKSKILQEAQRILTKNEAFRLFKTSCPTHKACKIVNGETLHRLFNVNPMDYSFEYGKVLSLKQSGIKYIFIDEISMIQEQMWNIIAHVKKLFGFIFCGFGDFKQLKPVNEEHIDFLNSWIVKFVFNNNLCELTEVHRFNESKLLQDAHTCANGGSIEFSDYTHDEHDLCICWTNQAVDALNQKWNKHYAKGKQIEVIGHKQSKFILHKDLRIMAYTNNKQFYNSEDFIVKTFNEETMTLINDTDNSEITVDLKLTKCFKPMYAITAHKAQGATFNKPYSIYEYKRMKHDMLYVCLTRTSKQEYVNFCDIQYLKPYTGYIYRYSYNNVSYIGCTIDIEKRKNQHKENNTNKFGRAIKQFGYKNFKFEILETVKFSEKEELYDIEDLYISKYDSIKNGYNTRRNYKDEL